MTEIFVRSPNAAPHPTLGIRRELSNFYLGILFPRDFSSHRPANLKVTQTLEIMESGFKINNFNLL